MDARTEIVTEFGGKLVEMLDSNTSQSLLDKLALTLDKYDIVRASTELACQDGVDINTTYLQNFILSKKLEGRTDKTLKRYYNINRQLLEGIGKPIFEITTFDIRTFLLKYKYHTPNKEVSNVTLDGMRLCYNSFFKWLTDNGLLPKNPCAGISAIKCEKTVKEPFTDSELEKMRRACTAPRDRALIEVLYSTGARVSEVSGMNRQDIDWKDSSLIVRGKGQKERKVYLSEMAMLYLVEYLNSRIDDNECLIAKLTAPYDRLSRDGIELRVRKIGETVGVKAHPHKFRHTLATNLMNRGAEIQEIAKLLGHENIETTLIYCKVDEKSVQNTYNKYI